MSGYTCARQCTSYELLIPNRIIWIMNLRSWAYNVHQRRFIPQDPQPLSLSVWIFGPFFVPSQKAPKVTVGEVRPSRHELLTGLRSWHCYVLNMQLTFFLATVYCINLYTCRTRHDETWSCSSFIWLVAAYQLYPIVSCWDLAFQVGWMKNKKHTYLCCNQICMSWTHHSSRVGVKLPVPAAMSYTAV